MESPLGVTANEISEIFMDVPNATARMALHRLHKQGCATRTKEEREFRYWITDKGIRRYDFLQSQEE